MKKDTPHSPRDLIGEYQTTDSNALSPEETLGRLRALSMSAMIDADSGLWINERCMGRYDSVYAQNKIRELSADASSAISAPCGSPRTQRLSCNHPDHG